MAAAWRRLADASFACRCARSHQGETSMRRWNRLSRNRARGSEQSRRRLPKAVPALSRLPHLLEMLEQRCLLTAIPTTITVSASQLQAAPGTPITLSAVVAGLSTPSVGTVTFSDNGEILGVASVVAGTARLDNLLFREGGHEISADYADLSGTYATSSTRPNAQSRITTLVLCHS